jgi:hypothetical protein
MSTGATGTCLHTARKGAWRDLCVRSATRASTHALQGTDGHRSRRHERRQLLWGNARTETPCASDGYLPQRRRLAQLLAQLLKTVSAARDQTIVDYHDSRPGKVATRDFQPIRSPLTRTTTSPPAPLLAQQAGKALRREAICADGPSPVQENPGFSRLRRASPNVPRP